MTRTKEQTEAIITALTKLSEKFYSDMDKIVNGVEIYEPNEVTIEPDTVTKPPTFKIDDVDVLSWDDNMKGNPFSNMLTFTQEGPMTRTKEQTSQESKE